MGQYATARLWYGVHGEIPEAARQELEDPPDNPYGEKVIDGVCIEMIFVFDRAVGAGGTIAHSYWGEQTVVDYWKFRSVKKAVDKFLDEYNVSGPRGVYLVADFG